MEENNNTLVVCQEMISPFFDSSHCDYRYKDKCYHTRLKYLNGPVVIRGFEDKLAFMASLLFSLWASMPGTMDINSTWEQLIKEFKDSVEYSALFDALKEFGLEFKDLKILKPYLKTTEVPVYMLVNSYQYLTKMFYDTDGYRTGATNWAPYIDDMVKTLINTDIKSFLFNDSIEIRCLVKRPKVDTSKFDRKRKKDNKLIVSLWE